jgi:hypothetical protein
MATPNQFLHVVPGKTRRTRRASQLPSTQSRALRRRLARQHGAAAAVAAVGVALTGLSLAHLAHGIELVTRAPAWESWLMAIGIDLGFLALEIGQLCAATPSVRAEISRFTKPAIIGTLVASAAMNAFAFGSQAEGWWVYPAVGLGLAIPSLIYALSRTAFGLAASR